MSEQFEFLRERQANNNKSAFKKRVLGTTAMLGTLLFASNLYINSEDGEYPMAALNILETVGTATVSVISSRSANRCSRTALVAETAIHTNHLPELMAFEETQKQIPFKQMHEAQFDEKTTAVAE